MKTFKFAPGLDLRVIDRGGEPWFVAVDVCDALSIHTRDVRKVLDANEVAQDLVDSIHLKTGAAGRPARTFVNESGLYSLILRSRKPEAKEFKRWVTQQVLPTIRKTGGYMASCIACRAAKLNANKAFREAAAALAARPVSSPTPGGRLDFFRLSGRTAFQPGALKAWEVHRSIEGPQRP